MENNLDSDGTSNRNQMNEQGKLLQDKINQEAKNVIKLNLAQDSAYWCLKQKYDDLEVNNNNLQKNMRAVQLEYEKVSSQYQDERRLRAELVNKVNASCKLQAVLQQHMEDLNKVNINIKNDEKILYEAYENATNVVKNMKLEVVEAREKLTAIINNEKEKNKTLSDHNDEYKNILATWKKDQDAIVCELKSKIENMEQTEKDTNRYKDELTRKLNDKHAELYKKDIAIFELEQQTKKLQDHNNQLKENLQVEKDTLENALRNKEQQINQILDENNNLKKKIVVSEEQLAVRETTMKQFEMDNKKVQDQLKEGNKTKDEIIQNINIKLEMKTSEYNECVKKLKDCEATLMELRTSLEKERGEVQAKKDYIETLLNENDQLVSKISGLEVRIRDLNVEVNNEKDKLINLQQSYKSVENLLSEQENINMDLRQGREQLEKQVHDLKLKCSTQGDEYNMLFSPVSSEGSTTNNNDTAEPLTLELPFENLDTKYNVEKEMLRRRWTAMASGKNISKLPKEDLFKTPYGNAPTRGKAVRGRQTSNRPLSNYPPSSDKDPFAFH